MTKNSNNEEDKKLEASSDESSKTNENNVLENVSKNIEKQSKTVEMNNNTDTNTNENCNCCNDDCKCGDCNKCSDNGNCDTCGSCELNSPKKCCAKKLIVLLSLAACVLSIFSLNKVNKLCAIKPNDNIEERIKEEVKDVITKNPQLILDAISKGLVDKRDNMLKQSAINVENDKANIIKSAIKIGDPSAKLVTILFFDPADTQCNETQKTIASMLKANKSICIYLLPVALLGEKSENLIKVYYQLQELDKSKSSNKLGEFLQEITKEGSTVDKVLDIIKVNKHDLNKYLKTAETKMKSNKDLLEKLKVSSLPAIFISKYKEKYEMIHDHNLLPKLV